MFYDVQITNSQNFGITIGIVVLVLGAVMIYTRKNFITSLVSMVTLLAILPTIIFCWGKWLLIVPIMVICVLMFFLCGASENTKTVVGTIYVFIYIMSTIAYLLYGSLIEGQTRDTKSENYVSENGTYRCYIVDTVDSSTGSTKIYVEPNTYDIHYNGIAFIAEDYERIVYNVRERKDVNIDWREDDLYVDDQLRFRASDAVENDWFPFLDYKTRINNAKETVSDVYKKVASKLFKKDYDDEDEDDGESEDTSSYEETVTTVAETESSEAESESSEDDSSEENQTDENVDDNVDGF
jgi:hypothetical protein